MSKKLESLRGMDDILPADSRRWQWLEAKTHDFFTSWGFEEIRTPILEPAELFQRSIGETSDIVSKEMYSFLDRGDRNITLRPEMTASVARSVLQHSLMRNKERLLLYYTGPMFRAERPQAGRKRQFHQIGAEVIHDCSDAKDTAADLLIISGIYGFFHYLDLKNIKIKMNDLAYLHEPGSKSLAKLKDYFHQHKDALDEDSLKRLEKNVLRILDSKNPQTMKIVSEIDWEEIAPRSPVFIRLMDELKSRGVPVESDPKLVRGLDYYTGIVFEVVAEGLGAQDAVAGGGRYNKLYSELGGKDFHCTGFSIGVERLMTALDHQNHHLDELIENDSVYVAKVDTALSTEAKLSELNDRLSHLKYCQEIAYNLCERGFFVTGDWDEFSLTKHLKKANKKNCRYIVFAGKEEMDRGEYKIKDLRSGDEKTLSNIDLINFLCEQHYQKI